MKTLHALSRSGLPAFALALLASLFTICITPANVMAQDVKKHVEPLKPPTPSTPDKPPLIWNYLVIAVMLGLAGGAALIPAKRGHQD